MASIARRMLNAAASAVARKLLPAAVPDNPGTTLALRSDENNPFYLAGREQFRMLVNTPPPILARPSEDDFLPTARPQILYAPPPAPVHPVYAPAPRPRRRRKVVIETITVEEREW